MRPPPFRHWLVHSRHRVAHRSFRVWVPADYDRVPDRRHPVLWLLDGQNVFADADAFRGQGWHADVAAQRLIDRGKLPPLLVVAVDNAGALRLDDYTPVPQRGRGGGADAFAEQLVHEIKPFVDAHYRTLPGPATNAIAGASLGGLCALHVALRHPDVFGHAAALSGSLWWAGGELLQRLAALRARLRVWLDAGRRESPPLRQSVRAAAELLAAKGWRKHRTARRADLRHVEVAGGRHDEVAWRRRLPRVLQFLFPMPPRPRRRRKAKAAAAARVTG
ncbi:MAG: alpha/beta hydrolase [Planctomycetes bacterium]|nr:alpha/beta hydrolase [Planctomycetota bacterium]